MEHQQIRKFTFRDINFGSILTELISIDTITDIEMRYGEVWVVDIKRGRYRFDLEGRTQQEREELLSVLESVPRQISIRMEVNYNEGNPILDGEAVYQSRGQLRINALHSSVTEGKLPGIAIRKTTYGLRLTEDNITEGSYATEDFLNLMDVLLKAGCNVMICGITGSGKTELLKYLARYIRDNEAIITIEDTFEAYLKRIYPGKEVLALKTSEHQGFSELIRACLRQNPDWIMVSETRGEEVRELMEAVGTGHRLISTIHTDSAVNIPYRMIEMAKADGTESERMFHQLHQNINIGIYIHYHNDENGSHRQIAEVCEFFIDEDNSPKSHIIYSFDFAESVFRAEKIRSRVILNKIRRSRTDVSKVKGLFLE